MGLKFYRNYKNILSANNITGNACKAKLLNGTDIEARYVSNSSSWTSSGQSWATDEDTHDADRYAEFTNIENITVEDIARGRNPVTAVFNENTSFSHTIAITNNGNTDVTVKSLQIAPLVNYGNYSGVVLCFGYYFEDGGLVVPANSTKIVTITLKNNLSLD